MCQWDRVKGEGKKRGRGRGWSYNIAGGTKELELLERMFNPSDSNDVMRLAKDKRHVGRRT